MITLLIFNFLPSLNKLLIHSHKGNAPGKTLTNGLKTIKGSSHNIAGEVYATFCYAYRTLDWPFYETLSRLVNYLPGTLRQETCKYVGITEYGY
jgi:hypothetical protein